VIFDKGYILHRAFTIPGSLSAFSRLFTVSVIAFGVFQLYNHITVTYTKSQVFVCVRITKRIAERLPPYAG